ncbi:hypothetical protein AB4076_08750 [Dyella sp. 2RAF44]|uniref:hypothetical protein n=1 Tax=Dyella sp. 2RAF44 TaxID=3233000 RepID=UPI003F921715
MKLMEGLKVAWKDPVLSKVIATGVVAAIIAIGGYLLAFWPSVRSCMAESWSVAISTTAVSNWLLAVMIWW